MTSVYMFNVHVFSGPPAKPVKPTVSKVTGTSVKLKWSAPEEDGGSPITTYQVHVDYMYVQQKERERDSKCSVSLFKVDVLDD